MEIIDYASDYDEEIKDLLFQLQKHISTIDREKYNILTNEFREKYFEKTMDEVHKYEGKIYLACQDERIVGLIVALINNEDEETYDFRAPKRGRISELVVLEDYRSKHIGKLLLDKMEEYLKIVGCKGVLIDVFAYNEGALRFYGNNGYFNRSIEMMKKI